MKRLLSGTRSPPPAYWPRPGSPEWLVHQRVQQQSEGKVPVTVAMGYAAHDATPDPMYREVAPAPKPQQTPGPKPSLSEGAKRLAAFAMTPREIKAALDKRVVGQIQAKKALAVAFSEHYNHARRCIEEPGRLRRHFHKPNILLFGPSGSGKSHLIRACSELVYAPLVKNDATKFSATGYVGRDVADILQQLVEAADNDIEVARFGTVHIDEIDKICDRGKQGPLSPPSGINTRDVQQSLLKLMEDLEVPVSTAALRKNAKTFSTKHVLFIFTGAFEHAGGGERDLSPTDFVELGLIREFVGRVPVRIGLKELTIHDLHKILKAEGDISPLSRYVEAFANHGITLTFDDDALALIARQAHDQRLGARGLLTVLEATLRDFAYHLPSCNVGGNFHLDRHTVDDPSSALRRLLGLDDTVDLDNLE